MTIYCHTLGCVAHILKVTLMSIHISIRHMLASQVSKQFIRELCDEIKSKYKPIHDIDVMIDDINGPYKKGTDKRCHLKVRGNNRLTIDIENVDTDVNCAIDNAFHLLRHALQRQLISPHGYLENIAFDDKYYLEA
jgi:ribosome-associated translation inhibitor RaiA